MAGKRREGMSAELDELSSTLLGDALDLLAEGEPMGVLLVVEDAAGTDLSYAFADDGAEATLEAARQQVRTLARSHGAAGEGLSDPVRYAIAYEGAIGLDDGSYADALILEFGERGYRSYSAYSLYEGRGTGDGFAWTDAAPAGEVDPLL